MRSCDEAEKNQRRFARLSRGCCPEHGIGLIQVGVAYRGRRPAPYGAIGGCPRGDCSFSIVIEPGTPYGKAFAKAVRSESPPFGEGVLR